MYRTIFDIETFLICLVLIFSPCLSLAQEGEHEDSKVEREKCGWLEAGTTIYLSETGREETGISGLILDAFSPARELRALVFSADTLWIGTEGGLYAWSAATDTVVHVDGPAFVSISALAVDETGSLLVGGEDGMSVRRDGYWHHYLPDSKPFFSRITGFFTGDDKRWVTTYGNGCGYIRGDTLVVLTRADSLLDDRVLCAAEQSADEIWFGTASGLCRADSFRWQSMRYGSRIPVGSVEDMIFDEEGNLFLSVARQGIVKYSLGRVASYGTRQGISGRDIHAFSLDASGLIWAAGEGGVSTYDGSGWTPYRLPGVPLGRYNFLSIHHDIEGNCYLGTDEGKLFVLARDYFREIDIPQRFPASMVTRIRESEGAVWFLSYSAAYRLGEELAMIAPPDRWYEGTMTDVACDEDGSVWLTTRLGILHLKDGLWELFDRRHGLPTGYFTSVSIDRAGGLWFATFNSGILNLTEKGWIHHSEKNGLPSNYISEMLVDGGGTTWAIFDSGEIASYRSGSWEAVELPQRRGAAVAGSITTHDSIPDIDPGIRFMTGSRGWKSDESAAAVCLGLDADGVCLACSREAIFRFSENGLYVIDFPYTARTVTPSAVLGSKRGEIWLGTTESGIFVRSQEGWRRISTASGLVDNHIVSLCEDSFGNIWIGTRFGGINRFAPSE